MYFIVQPTCINILMVSSFLIYLLCYSVLICKIYVPEEAKYTKYDDLRPLKLREEETLLIFLCGIILKLDFSVIKLIYWTFPPQYCINNRCTFIVRNIANPSDKDNKIGHAEQIQLTNMQASGAPKQSLGAPG